MTTHQGHQKAEKSPSQLHHQEPRKGGESGAGPVLLVDDDPQILKALQVSLERAGFEVGTAADGMEAYALLKAKPFRCMLLDIRMPRISGVELLLLMQSEGLHVPTIAMASFEDYRESEMKQFENVVKYMPKPFPLADMVSAVRAATS